VKETHVNRIYRTSDVIELEVDGLKIGISPLTFEQKMEIQGQMLTGNAMDAMKAAALAVKYSLKKIEGLETEDGSAYQLSFESNRISDACWDELQNISQSGKLTTVCLNLLNSIPEDFTDPATGKKIPGVSRIKRENKDAKK
jgi:isopentenyl diphosphate isomerase/L-lactate dehydrogenase-like FMN-dependent dehydrogenase